MCADYSPLYSPSLYSPYCPSPPSPYWYSYGRRRHCYSSYCSSSSSSYCSSCCSSSSSSGNASPEFYYVDENGNLVKSLFEIFIEDCKREREERLMDEAFEGFRLFSEREFNEGYLIEEPQTRRRSRSLSSNSARSSSRQRSSSCSPVFRRSD